MNYRPRMRYEYLEKKMKRICAILGCDHTWRVCCIYDGNYYQDLRLQIDPDGDYWIEFIRDGEIINRIEGWDDEDEEI